MHILDVELADNTKAHLLQKDGTYEKVDKRGKVLVNSQLQFCRFLLVNEQNNRNLKITVISVCDNPLPGALFQWLHNTKAHLLQKDGTYEKVDKRGKVLVNSQLQFCREAEEAAPKPADVVKDRIFIPAEPVED